jgi:drug/metabolite transporter (DMT)-like permease
MALLLFKNSWWSINAEYQDVKKSRMRSVLSSHTPNTLASLAGILAILLWSTNIAFSKSIMEKEGTYNAAIYIFLFSGLCNALILSFYFGGREFFRKLKGLPISYYTKTAIFFIFSNILLYLAIARVSTNEELVIVSILNYSWPMLIYVLKIPVLGLPFKRALLAAGILFSGIGLVLAFMQGYSGHEIRSIWAAGDDNLTAYFLALLNSVCWALYSNLTIRSRREDDIAGIPVVFLIVGILFLVIQWIRHEGSTVSFSRIYLNPELLYQVLGPTGLGYLLWYIGMRRGNRNLITSLSFFIPVLSMFIIGLKFRIHIGPVFWVAIGLLILGSYACYRAFSWKNSV